MQTSKCSERVQKVAGAYEVREPICELKRRYNELQTEPAGCVSNGLRKSNYSQGSSLRVVRGSMEEMVNV